MPDSLEGKVAFISGAGSGIGRATALALATEAMALALCDRDINGLDSTINSVREIDPSLVTLALPVDVGNSSLVNESARLVVDRFGRVDVIAHCAGISGSMSPIVEMSDEQWNDVLTINLSSGFHIAHAFGRQMMAQGNGTIVFLASDGGLNGVKNAAHYSASKGGVISLAKSLAREFAPHGVTVNAINPGVTNTPMGRRGMSDEQWSTRAQTDALGKLSEPEEIAEIIRFLAKTAGSFMTGQLITTRMRVR